MPRSFSTLTPRLPDRLTGQGGRVFTVAALLACAGVPLYIHLPRFATELGYSLGTVAGLLLALRALDFLQDPMLGLLVDRFPRQRRGLAMLALIGLGAGFVAVFTLQPGLPGLAAGLVLVFTAYSLGTILFYGQGAALAGPGGGQAHYRLAGLREAGTLAGIIAAAVLPELLARGLGPLAGYAGFGLLLAGAALAGLYLGRLSVPIEVRTVAEREESPKPAAAPQDAEVSYIDPDAPPLFFSPGIPQDGSLDIPVAEVAMAADAGVHQYFLPVSLTWEGPEHGEGAFRVMQRVAEADPMAAMMLSVDLNPPQAWLEMHRNAARAGEDGALAYPSVCSQAWLEDAAGKLAALVGAVEASAMRGRVMGYVLCALRDGRWMQPAGVDTTGAAAQGFRDWLRRRYVTNTALQAAWGVEDATLDAASLPDVPAEAGLDQVFYVLPSQQPIVDYLRFSSEAVADAIAALVAAVKGATKSDALVLAPYGYSYELKRNDRGHFALGNLLDSDIDGFVSPVSYVDRGLGGAGGPMGPINSAQYHGLSWYLIDDTRTGVGRDPMTGKISRLKGLRAKDVYNVQRRNFALAAVHGLGLVWSDPQGEGWLHDAEQWNEFGTLREVYTYLDAEGGPPHEAEALARPLVEEFQESPGPEDPEEEAGEGSIEGAVAPGPPNMPDHVDSGLALVVDESSRFYQRCGSELNTALLHQAREAAIRAGLPLQFCLLQDVVEDFAPPVSVYLFVNAFHLPTEQRRRLHERLARDRACAIWLYAPGYVNGEASVENVARTVGMKVAEFEGATRAGSAYLLSGRWMSQDEHFGLPVEIAPLFYVDDSEADVLGRFTATEKASLAVRFFESGWTSVFIAEPTLSPRLLREILRILEQHLHFRPTGREFFDASYISERLFAVHARQPGDRAISLGRFYDAQDLFDTAIGWLEKESFTMPLNSGETRLLELTPL